MSDVNSVHIFSVKMCILLPTCSPFQLNFQPNRSLQMMVVQFLAGYLESIEIGSSVASNGNSPCRSRSLRSNLACEDHYCYCWHSHSLVDALSFVDRSVLYIKSHLRVTTFQLCISFAFRFHLVLIDNKF